MADERIVIHDQDGLRHRQTPRARTVLALDAIVLLPLCTSVYFCKSHPLADKWGNRAFTRFPCAVLGCLFLSSFDNVPACFPPHISEPHLFFVKQTVDFRD